MKGKVPQKKYLQRNLLPSETTMDYTKCMKLTKKHGIVSENMEYTRMFWSLILPIHHNMKHEMAPLLYQPKIGTVKITRVLVSSKMTRSTLLHTTVFQN